MHESNESGKIACFLALNAFVEKEEIDLRGIRQVFLEHLTSFLSESDRYIPSHNYSKTFNWVRLPFEVSTLQVHSELDCIAEQLVEQQSRQLWRDKLKNVSLTQFWANVQSMEPNLSDLCQQKLFCLFQLHTFVNLFFQHLLWLKPSTATNCNQKTTSDVRWRQQTLISTNLETSSETRFSLKLVNADSLVFSQLKKIL